MSNIQIELDIEPSGKMFSKSLEEKYDVTGPIGTRGEIFVAELLRSRGWFVDITKRDKVLQGKGFDLIISDGSEVKKTIDVKNNIGKNNELVLEIFKESGKPGWIQSLNKTNDYYVHVKVPKNETKSQILYKYSKTKMWEYLNDLGMFEATFVKGEGWKPLYKGIHSLQQSWDREKQKPSDWLLYIEHDNMPDFVITEHI
jgi:hypothetical protein